MVGQETERENGEQLGEGGWGSQSPSVPGPAPGDGMELSVASLEVTCT